ncbi:aldehyde dehydrogenase family protein [Bacillus sp. AGMB 02131]|uniref:Aldehyde dehydrogenase n=1 Tax=Peribacillus faecalis TaxID=2772559 RepID=A0A927H9X3_9BACI|nr:aldehyde dehydrogenase family protein [Peribacillus faecalis]MBD3106942.1 aldehyde dehydrogenase family protein [Peribacillus faecalis]
MADERWEVYSPSTKQYLGEMKETAPEQISIMFNEARQDFDMWRKLTVKERLAYIEKLRDILLNELEKATEVISGSNGKVKVDALVADIMPVLDFISFLKKDAATILERQKAKTPIVFLGKQSYVDYMPRGVVAVISPWNYPFQLTMVPVLSAIIGGNTVIAKPSEITPIVGTYMEELFEKAGFPKGVIQFAHGGKEVGEAIIEQKPDYIFFTGSVATGKIIASEAAKHLIPVTLELGGKDPMIVCHDANIERAAKGAVWGAFTNSGQVCMSVERLYVDERIYEPFVKAVQKEVALLKQGVDVKHDIGSMTFKKQVTIVREHVQDALEKGAVLATGKRPEEWEEDTMFIEPMVFTSVTEDMKLIQEETFGPLLPIIPFGDEKEAIKKANASPYGLNASVWSSDLRKAEQIASELVSGAVIINDVLISVANHHLPFGGAKQSGIGSYHGVQGLRMFCYEKAVMKDAGKKRSELQWYPYEGKYDAFKSLIQSYYGSSKNYPAFLKSFLDLLKKSK